MALPGENGVGASAPLANIGSVPNFSGNPEDFEDFKDQLTFFFEANNVVSASQKRAVFLSCTGTHTYALAKKLCAPDRPGAKTFDELIAIMSSHFIPTACVWVERDRFDARVQGPDETFKDFLADLRQLAEKCKFEVLEQALLRQVLRGMRNLSLKEQLFSLKYEDLTLQVAVDRAIASEQARHYISQLRSDAHRGESGSVFSINSGARVNTNDSMTRQFSTARSRGLTRDSMQREG
jgi:hypothetical protein